MVRIFSKFQQKLKKNYIRWKEQEDRRVEVLTLLRRLSEERGMSGYEYRVGTILKQVLAPCIDDAHCDRLGNVIMVKAGEGLKPHPRIMLAAHMDEIGLMVTKIEEEGFLRFTTIGGIDGRVLPGQEVIVQGQRPLPGVVGTKPPHLQEPAERKKAIPTKDLYIDTGYSREELERLVKVGDPVTIKRDLQELANHRVAGKALDNRAGVTTLALCLKELTRLRHRADVYAVATVQEEVGVRGAIVSSYGVAPDLAIVIDVCHGDMPGVTEEEGFPLEKGPVLGLGPHVHPRLFAALKETAREIGVSYQVEASPTPGGTDAWAIQIAREGVPTALVSIPLRYMHTSTETLSLKDLQETTRLLVAFIQRLDPAFVEGLSCF